jgi:branched-chain amino acid transport system substrate-binding protein
LIQENADSSLRILLGHKTSYHDSPYIDRWLKFLEMKTKRKGMAQTTAIAVIVVIIIAALAGIVSYYFVSTAPSSTTTATSVSTKVSTSVSTSVSISTQTSTSIKTVTQTTTQPIIFGILGPMTDVTGIDEKEGAQLAVTEINAHGGVLGRPLELVSEDTQEANPTIPVNTGLAAMNRIVTVDHAAVIIGGERSDVVLAEEAQLATYKVPYLDTGAADTTLLQNVINNYAQNKYFFMVSPVNSTALATGLIQFYGYLHYVEPTLTKVYIMAEDIAVWHSLVPVLQGYLPSLGFTIVGTTYFPYGTSDFSAQLSTIRSSGAQIMGMLAAGQDSVQLMQQWSTLQVPVLPVGIDVAAESPTFWGQTNGGAKYEAIEVGIGDTGTPINTIGANFYANYSKYYNTLPIYTADGAYESVYIAAHAIEQAGTTNGTALIPYIEKTNMTGPDGRILFDRSHSVIYNPDYTKGAALAIVQWTGYNQYTPVWPTTVAKPIALPPWM